MKKLIEVEFDTKVDENSIIVFKNDKWITVRKSVFLNDIYDMIKKTNDDLKKEWSERVSKDNKIEEKVQENKHDIKILLGEE